MTSLLPEARRHHAAQLAMYSERDESARERGIDRLSFRDPHFADYLKLLRGIDFERGRLAWCDWVLTELESRG